MSVQIFHGPTTESAMARVRKSLGEDAVIVDVRGGTFGPIEVLASVPTSGLPFHILRSFSDPGRTGSPPATPAGSGASAPQGRRRSPQQHRRVSRPVGGGGPLPEMGPSAPEAEVGIAAPAARHSKSEPAAPQDEGRAPPRGLTIVPRETPPGRSIDEISPSARVSNPPRIFESPLLHDLRELDLPHDVCQRLAGAGGAHSDPWSRVQAWVESVWPVRLPEASIHGGPLVVGFFGPRSVGRSTLIRGLAARAAIAGDAGVCWLQVGFPGRRVEDADDLRTPMGVDLRIAHYAGEFVEVARDHRHSDVVLIDLPGIDVFDAAERAALARYVQGAARVFPSVVWHAVLPATWGVRHCTAVLDSLADFRPDAIAWTHLDDALDASTILATTVRSHLGPAFLHGDREGDGATSRVADWNGLLQTLIPQRTPEPSAATT